MRLLLLGLIFPVLTQGATVYECAPNKVKTGSVVVNIVEEKGKYHAEVLQAPSKKPVKFKVEETKDGFLGQAKSKFELKIGQERTHNKNIDGYSSNLKAQVPGKGLLTVNFVCGDRIPKNLR